MQLKSDEESRIYEIEFSDLEPSKTYKIEAYPVKDDRQIGHIEEIDVVTRKTMFSNISIYAIASWRAATFETMASFNINTLFVFPSTECGRKDRYRTWGNKCYHPCGGRRSQDRRNQVPSYCGLVRIDSHVYLFKFVRVVVKDEDKVVVVNETRPKKPDKDFDEAFGPLNPLKNYTIIIVVDVNGTEEEPIEEEFTTGNAVDCLDCDFTLKLKFRFSDGFDLEDLKVVKNGANFLVIQAISSVDSTHGVVFSIKYPDGSSSSDFVVSVNVNEKSTAMR